LAVEGELRGKKMPDPVTTLGLAKTTSEILKEALDFARKTKNSELAEKLIDLYQNFLQLSESNQHVLSSRSYFLKETDGTEVGPFCSVCWDVDGRLVRQSRFGLETICQYCVRRNKR
jgi:hypothetical protein